MCDIYINIIVYFSGKKYICIKYKIILKKCLYMQRNVNKFKDLNILHVFTFTSFLL